MWTVWKGAGTFDGELNAEKITTNTREVIQREQQNKEVNQRVGRNYQKNKGFTDWQGQYVGNQMHVPRKASLVTDQIAASLK